MSNPSDTVAELHSELTSALRAVENAEDTFKAAVEAVQAAFNEAKDTLQDIAFRPIFDTCSLRQWGKLLI